MTLAKLRKHVHPCIVTVERNGTVSIDTPPGFSLEPDLHGLVRDASTNDYPSRAELRSMAAAEYDEFVKHNGGQLLVCGLKCSCRED
jgi:hypothetical protein